MSLILIKKSNNPSFAYIAMTHREVSMELFNRVNLILDHINIEKELSKYYKNGQSIDG